MRKRALILAALFTFVGVLDAAADCVGCLQISCTNRRGQQTLGYQCDAMTVEYGKGHNNCKTMPYCGGCMGYSCDRDGEVPLFAPVPGTTKIETVAAMDAVSSTAPEK